MDINKDIIIAIKPEMCKFFNKMRENKEMFGIMLQGADEYGEEGDASYWTMLFLQLWLKQGGMKSIIEFLERAGVDKKIYKDFVYKLLKLNHKSEMGMWSWNEIQEWNIDCSDIKKCTAKYSLL